MVWLLVLELAGPAVDMVVIDGIASAAECKRLGDELAKDFASIGKKHCFEYRKATPPAGPQRSPLKVLT